MFKSYWNNYSLPFFLTLSLILFFNIPFYSSGLDGFSHPRNSLSVIPIAIWLFVNILIKSNKTLSSSTFTLLILSIPLIFLEASKESSYYIIPLVLVYLAIFVSSVNTSNTSKALILKLLFISIFVQAAYGCIQELYFFKNDWFLTRDLRPSGGTLQVNVFSSIITLGFILSYFIFNRRSRLKYLIYSFNLTVPTLLILTQSRIGFLSYIVGLLLLILYQLTIKKNNQNKTWWLVIIQGVILGIVLNTYVSNEIKETKQFTKDPRRLVLYEHTAWMFLQKPLSGWGFSNFPEKFHYSYVQRYHDEELENYSPGYVIHPHNELLFFLAGSGIYGTLAVILSTLSIMLISFKHNKNRTIRAFIIISPIILHSMTEHPLYSSPHSLFITALILGIYLSSKEISLTPLIKYVTYYFKIGLSLIACVFLISNFKSAIYLSELTSKPYETSLFDDFGRTEEVKKILHFRSLLNESLQSNQNRSREEINIDIKQLLNDYARKELAILYVSNCNKNNSCQQKELEKLKLIFPDLML